jgi:hypothetical protein
MSATSIESRRVAAPRRVVAICGIVVSGSARLSSPVSYTVSFFSPMIDAARCVLLSTEP